MAGGNSTCKVDVARSLDSTDSTVLVHCTKGQTGSMGTHPSRSDEAHDIITGKHATQASNKPQGGDRGLSQYKGMLTRYSRTDHRNADRNVCSLVKHTRALSSQPICCTRTGWHRTTPDSTSTCQHQGLGTKPSFPTSCGRKGALMRAHQQQSAIGVNGTVTLCRRSTCRDSKATVNFSEQLKLWWSSPPMQLCPCTPSAVFLVVHLQAPHVAATELAPCT